MEEIQLVRDRDETGTSHVESREQYVELLKQGMEGLLEASFTSSKKKNKEEMYNAIADMTEMYQCYVTQLLTTKRDVSTKARHAKLMQVAKERAETLGGFFNGITKEV